MRRALGMLLPAMGVALSVALLVGALAVQVAGGDGMRLFGAGVLAWMAGIGAGLWINRSSAAPG